MTFDEFLGHCTACGGNWTAMLMTGIKEVAPQVYEKLPDRDFDFNELCFIVNHLCHDRPHPRYCLAFGNVIEFNLHGEFEFREATEKEQSMTMEQFQREYNGWKDADFEQLRQEELQKSLERLQRDLRDRWEFHRVCKRKYSVHVCRADLTAPEKKIFNHLEKVVYTPSEQKPFVVKGTAGECWVIDPVKLCKTYEMLDGSPINPDAIGVDWVEVKTRPDAAVNWAMCIYPDRYGEAASAVEIKTSWGDILHPNLPGIPHGEGDYAVCSDADGAPNFDDMWVVNGEVFKNTYQSASDHTNIFSQE